MVIAEQLHFDVAGPHQLTLEVDRGVAERRSRFRPRGASRRSRDRAGSVTVRMPFAAATGDGFHEQRIADRGGQTAPSLRPKRRRQAARPCREQPAHQHAIAAARAAVLLPINAMASGVGPTNVSPASRTAAAKLAFSARKP